MLNPGFLRRSLFLRLLTSYIAVVMLTLVLLGTALGLLFPHFELYTRSRELVARGRQIAELVAQENLLADGGVYQGRPVTVILDTLDNVMDARIWLVDRTGLVRMTSTPHRQWRGAAMDRADLVRLQRGEIISRRTEIPMVGPGISVAVPIPDLETGQIAGAVFLHSRLQGFWTRLRDARTLTLYAAIAALALAAAIGYVFSRSLTRPIRDMTAAVAAMQQGDFGMRVDDSSPDELGTLARGFNQLSAQLGATLEALRRENQLRQDFLVNVSHDLRTPLTTLRGFLQALSDGVVSDKEAAQRSAQVMLKETLRLTRLVNTLVDLSRLQSGSLELQREAVALAPFVEDLSTSFLIRAEEKGVALNIDLPPSLPPVWADRNRLEQIVGNLLDNAVKFTRPGDTITVQGAEEGGMVRLDVVDTGPGISPDDLPFIWERFYKADKSRSGAGDSGAGLGLVIVRDLVNAHGGRVSVSSGDGVTRFSVWLPRAGGQARPLPS